MLTIIGIAGVVAGLTAYYGPATVAAQRLTRAQRRTPRFTPAELGLAYQDIRIPARGGAVNIAAWYVPAPHATRAVIIAHGVGGTRGREFGVSSLPLVEHLAGIGISVLLIDLRGHGESDAARMTYGIRERDDVLGAVDWLLAHGYASGNIGVLGLSMGGVAGIGAAGEEPAIGALIVDSACADLKAMMRIHFKRLSKLPLVFLPGALLVAWLLTGEDLARLRPAKLLGRIARRPVLIIHAQGDQLVPVAHARALAAAGAAELWLTQSARHLGSFNVDQQAYIRRVARFFDGALGGHSPTGIARLERETYRARLAAVDTLSMFE